MLIFDVSADAFLHHMVRNIVGCLVYVGKGKYPPAWLAEVLAGRERSLAAPTFAPDGLYLRRIKYEAKWGLPQMENDTMYGRNAVTRIKICGITRVEDALAAAHSGADAIGLVFYERSPRHVSIAQAKQLAGALPPFVTVVGLFVNAEAAFVREVLASVPLDLLQFHGDESPEYCAQFDRPYLKAIRVKAGVDLLQCAAVFAVPKDCCWMPMWKGYRAARGQPSTGH